MHRTAGEAGSARDSTGRHRSVPTGEGGRTLGWPANRCRAAAPEPSRAPAHSAVGGRRGDGQDSRSQARRKPTAVTVSVCRVRFSLPPHKGEVPSVFASDVTARSGRCAGPCLVMKDVVTFAFFGLVSTLIHQQPVAASTPGRIACALDADGPARWPRPLSWEGAGLRARIPCSVNNK